MVAISANAEISTQPYYYSSRLSLSSYGHYELVELITTAYASCLAASRQQPNAVRLISSSPFNEQGGRHYERITMKGPEYRISAPIATATMGQNRHAYAVVTAKAGQQ